MKPTYVIVQYRDQNTMEWRDYAQLLVDLDGPGSPTAAQVQQVNQRLADAKLSEAMRVELEDSKFHSVREIESVINDCLSAQHLEWPVDLQGVELRQLQRALGSQGAAIERLTQQVGQLVGVFLQQQQGQRFETDFKTGERPAQGAQPPSVRLTLQQRVDRANAELAREDAGRTEEVQDVRDRAEEIVDAARARVRGRRLIDNAVDETTRPPALVGDQGGWLEDAPVIKRDGQARGVVPALKPGARPEARAAANVMGRGWGVGGAEARTTIERILPSGEVQTIPAPVVGETLRTPHSDIPLPPRRR